MLKLKPLVTLKPVGTVVKKITTEATIVDKDLNAAKKIKNQLDQSLDLLSKNFELINKSLSEFNSPGLSSAYYNAIKRGLDAGKFNKSAAKLKLSEYFKGR